MRCFPGGSATPRACTKASAPTGMSSMVTWASATLPFTRSDVVGWA